MREAARQQLRRMTATKKKQKDRNPEEWLVEAYKSQNKGQLAQMLVDCNFDKEGEPFPRKHNWTFPIAQ